MFVAQVRRDEMNAMPADNARQGSGYLRKYDGKATQGSACQTRDLGQLRTWGLSSNRDYVRERMEEINVNCDYK